MICQDRHSQCALLYSVWEHFAPPYAFSRISGGCSKWAEEFWAGILSSDWPNVQSIWISQKRTLYNENNSSFTNTWIDKIICLFPTSISKWAVISIDLVHMFVWSSLCHRLKFLLSIGPYWEDVSAKMLTLSATWAYGNFLSIYSSETKALSSSVSSCFIGLCTLCAWLVYWIWCVLYHVFYSILFTYLYTPQSQ